ncbi:hypothetical protein LTR94_024922, partial [Friedmanniomyces endolithicus]
AVIAQPLGARPIAELAQPEVRLAGARFNPLSWSASRTPYGWNYYSDLSIKTLPNGATRAVSGLPQGGRIISVAWSPDAAKILVSVAGFEAQGAGHGVWIIDAANAQARRLTTLSVNTVASPGEMQPACLWLSDSASIVCRTVPSNRAEAPSASAAPAPSIQSSQGRAAPGRTYQDLLTSPQDEALFRYHDTTQIAVIGLDGSVRPIGEPGVHDRISPSPDGEWLLVSERRAPFSYQFPLDKFPQRLSVVRLADGRQTILADKPLESDVPISFDAVGEGRREMQWRADAPAELFWVEAADKGDPRIDASVRDQLYLQSAPFDGEARLIGGLAKRFAGVTWGDHGQALVEESWRASRLRRISSLDLSSGEVRSLYEGSSQDAYADPGHALTGQNALGAVVFKTTPEGRVLFVGDGATPEGDRPFLAALDMASGDRRIVWRSSADLYERAEGVMADGRVLIRREGPALAPNYWLVSQEQSTASAVEQAVTDFQSPYGDVVLPKGQVLSYRRAVGVPLTAVLFTPPSWTPKDGPLPTILHAYPVEYVSADAAGQMTGSPNRFPVYGAADWRSIVQLMTLRGYAVLYNTSLPIVGSDGKQPNDTYVEQLVAGAKAAIDEGARLGVVDPDRMGVTGHSYGAFMTANLLAHSDLFEAGREERTYWQAPELYYAMSPFSYADRINEPLSLMHGINDDNQGTFPVQSERFYAALKGQGATVRLTMLPFEAHRYAAAESLNQMVWEWDDWFGRYVKNAEPAQGGR